MRWFGVVIASLLLVGVSKADHWAVLVAGSNGWGNYRHQADICHAYQVLTERGFPKDNIITMMYDDIANNENNPLPGQIINQPYGPNVYKGVVIDYKGEELTPQNFLNVLSGNATGMKGIGSGRVLKSNADDVVFVNFADHGGTGLLCFPSDSLYADDLENTLRGMAEAKKFEKLLFYVEACEAGSMFDNILEEHNNILVSTASARDESSFGWYCSNPQLDTCLGDLYSISWLEHMDKLLGKIEGNSESVFHQYDVVRTLVNESHVQLYGDFKLGLDQVSLYFDEAALNPTTSFMAHSHSSQTQVKDFAKGVPSREVELHTARTRLIRAPAHLKQMRKAELELLLVKREFADRKMTEFFKMLSKGNSKYLDIITNSKFHLNKKTYPCYKNLIKNFNEQCFNIAQNNYMLKYLSRFVSVCNLDWLSESETIQIMKMVCNTKTKNMKNIV